ncbi:hypothetical protein MFLAVUS_007223 [Mucor flavus]|uniref:F-box domain-containing protein n=1 Tax=Mucor flavus TaxID=439312 RepID=A0ABP9Z3T2_9FUNG
MRNLPAKVYTNIFQYLKRKDFQTCYCVCKSWYMMAIPLNSEAVTIQNLNISLVKSHLHNFSRKCFKYSNLIKKLVFKDTRDYEYYKYGTVTRQLVCQDHKNHGDQDEFSKLEFLDLLDQLPNLNEIDFSGTYYFEEYVEYLLQADMQHINNINTGSNFSRIPNYFPNQLADLRIKLFCQKFFKWIDMVGMELALELMEKVGGVKETYIGFVIYEVYQNQHNRKENMTKYFTLLNSFRGTRQTHCTANFNRGIGEVRNLGYSFRYSSLGRLVVTYNLYPDDLYESDHAYIITLPDKTNSIIGPEIFHNLEFNLWSENENDEVHLALSYSFLNCPGLQSLSIVYHKYGSFRSSLGFICKDEKFSSEQAKRDINFLQIENITAKCLDLVTTHLYNIQIVSLTAKDWSCKGNNPVIDLTV